MFITALQVAESRGMVPDSDNGYSGAAFAKVNVPMLGGCAGCHATIAAYNAYPTKTGFWMCDMCVQMSEQGFNTVEEYEAFEKRESEANEDYYEDRSEYPLADDPIFDKEADPMDYYDPFYPQDMDW